MRTMASDDMPAPLVVRCRGQPLEALLEKEWLLGNRIGSYASTTVVGCNTRRYHGLLVGALRPPVGRVMALSLVLEQLVDGSATYDLSTIEFPGTVSPRGVDRLEEFRNDAAATTVCRAGGLELTREVILAESANAVAIRYTLRGGAAQLRLLPFAALRDYHSLRKADSPHQMSYQTVPGGVLVQDRMQPLPPLLLIAREGRFEPRPQWWYRFYYRADLARGQDAFEDLYTPGVFAMELEDGRPVQFTASLGEPIAVDFAATVERRRSRLGALAASLGPQADLASRRLAVASDAFVVDRCWPDEPTTATILAGYHWFADWGRDAFVALPGLLLTTGRFDKAREVFQTFLRRLSAGLIPNRFDDHTFAAHYNSIDASLWFIVACERYLEATGDVAFWLDRLMPAAAAILRAYRDGTQFDIHADADGLLAGGSYRTQLTWMDVSLGGEVVTPRHGKAVEVNALWYCAHRILARRCLRADDQLAREAAGQADVIGAAFRRTFWYAGGGYLYDCVSDGRPDASMRPNQILAVSLPDSPLSPQEQQSVVRRVQERLLTPMGLRTLDPTDPRYRQRYGGSWESRDRAYHQGTVWAWLIGPFIEAYLKVEGYRSLARAQARRWLSAFDAHLEDAGVGYVSEIFDADPPHVPRGCIAQAWSVAEVLRAKRLVESPGPSEA